MVSESSGSHGVIADKFREWLLLVQIARLNDEQIRLIRTQTSICICPRISSPSEPKDVLRGSDRRQEEEGLGGVR